MQGELLDIEHRWAKAFRTMDHDVFDNILAPEFRLSFVADPRAPRTVSREEWFAMLERMSMGNYEFLSAQETHFGNVGIVRLQCRFHDWTLDGKPVPSDYVVTDVFIRRDNRWQVVNRISEPEADAPRFWE